MRPPVCLAVVLAASMVSGMLALGCARELPEPDSAGARLYRERCSGCHRLFQPRTMTAEMWRLQSDRMQEDLRRGGLPPLSVSEMDLLLTYLGKHSGGK